MPNVMREGYGKNKANIRSRLSVCGVNDMGFRFSRRVKLFPGCSINFSKSGVGFSVGPRGLSFSSGPRGSFLSTGIPGTGLSHRQKLGSSSRSHSTNSVAMVEQVISVSIDLNEDTGVVTVLDSGGNPITDETLLRKIRRDEGFKAAVAGLITQVKQKIDDEAQKFIDIHKLTSPVRSDLEWQALLEAQPAIYTAKPYPEEEPTKKKIEAELWEQACREIRKLLFWRNKGLREKFVSDNLDATFTERHDAWLASKATFDRRELGIKQHEDEVLLKQHNDQMALLRQAISGAPEFINHATDDFLQSISLPVEFSVDYEYDADRKVLSVDLDLPEIEHLPIEKASITAAGKLSIKERSGKDLRTDYAVCVTGLAFFFAGHLFNVSPAIAEVVVSGYTQRLSKKTGNIENDYIYSVRFDRTAFAKLNYARLHPVSAVTAFPHRMVLSTAYEFKAIEPFN